LKTNEFTNASPLGESVSPVATAPGSDGNTSVQSIRKRPLETDPKEHLVDS